MTRPRDQADLIAEDFYADVRAGDATFGSDLPEHTPHLLLSDVAPVNAEAQPTPHGASRPPSSPRSTRSGPRCCTSRAA